QCCVVGTIQCRGIMMPAKLIALPENTAVCDVSMVGTPVTLSTNPSRREAVGTNAGSSWPIAGILPAPWEKSAAIFPGDAGATTIGKNGGVNERLSATPRSSRTL